MPVAYTVGGALAPWYFWPSAVAGWLLVVVGCVASIRRQRGVRQQLACAAAATVLVSLVVGQWLYTASWGTQENLYRGGIGDEIRTLAASGDTLLLEPAGYVPFHAQLWTWDEIGITSPAVTEYTIELRAGLVDPLRRRPQADVSPGTGPHPRPPNARRI